MLHIVSYCMHIDRITEMLNFTYIIFKNVCVYVYNIIHVNSFICICHFIVFVNWSWHIIACKKSKGIKIFLR